MVKNLLPKEQTFKCTNNIVNLYYKNGKKLFSMLNMGPCHLATCIYTKEKNCRPHIKIRCYMLLVVAISMPFPFSTLILILRSIPHGPMYLVY